MSLRMLFAIVTLFAVLCSGIRIDRWEYEGRREHSVEWFGVDLWIYAYDQYIWGE